MKIITVFILINTHIPINAHSPDLKTNLHHMDLKYCCKKRAPAVTSGGVLINVN